METVRKLDAVGYYSFLGPDEYHKEIVDSILSLTAFYEENMKGK
jgi:hypothetical protein